jgi:hypothetical protein
MRVAMPNSLSGVQTDMAKILIIIPAFNEAETIGEVITSVKKVKNSLDIVVVNDGSTDNTKLEVEKKGVPVLNLPFNLGIGGSVQAGLKYAKENSYDIAIQIDADGQHNPKDIQKLLAAFNSKTDIVIGSRYKTKTSYKSPFVRMLGNRIFSSLIFFTCGKRVYDATSGFRLYGKRIISLFADNYPIDFPEPESLVMVFKRGFRAKEVPVNMRSRMGGASSVTAIKAIYLMISITIAILVQALKENYANRSST